MRKIREEIMSTLACLACPRQERCRAELRTEPHFEQGSRRRSGYRIVGWFCDCPQWEEDDAKSDVRDVRR